MFGAWIVLGLVWLASATDYANNESVQRFQEYLQINSTSYNDMTPAVEFWQARADEAGVPMTVLELYEGFPIVILKWAGTDSSLSSIMLNSHMDVVPAEESEGWTYPPFSGHLDDDGVIWGRGTQDMKSVGIQYYEALKRLKDNNVPLLRDVYMTLMPDEEIGGEFGMQPFLESYKFKTMNVGFEMDEGTSYDLPLVALFYQDKVVWQIQVDCFGQEGHGSTFPATDDTATGQCRNVINKLLAFRDEQYEIEQTATIFDAGIYTSVNLNKMNAGTANNIIPSRVSLVFDIRPKTTQDEVALDAQLRQWIAESGNNITLTYILKDNQSPATLISSDNPYWVTANEVFTELGLMVLPIVPPGSTDARFVRGSGIPAFGVSFMPATELLLHSVNERLSAATFLTGIDIYEALIPRLANLSASQISSDPSVYVYSTTTA